MKQIEPHSLYSLTEVEDLRFASLNELRKCGLVFGPCGGGCLGSELILAIQVYCKREREKREAKRERKTGTLISRTPAIHESIPSIPGNGNRSGQAERFLQNQGN